MKEATFEKQIDEFTVMEEETKPYTFRKLSAEDMFLMFRILGKIGFKELKSSFEGDTLQKITSASEIEDTEKKIVAIGVAIGLDAVDLLLNNIPKCENEVFQLLAQTSNIKEKEIRADAVLFTEMLVDFVKKEEFPAFFKAVSKLFK